MNGINAAGNSLLAARQASLRAEINFAVAAKQQDAQEMQGDVAVQMIEAAGQLTRELGKGNHVDSKA